mmetsp:Transcript_18376/g.33022  ORF Transcript_18376/g.33022 Transcript_18376/m.33022 type:complete len:257 (-) Transcript_18376:2974-3744(-)
MSLPTLPFLKYRQSKPTSILGVPKKNDYPLKEELYKLRKTEPNSPTYFKRQASSVSQEEGDIRLRRNNSVLQRKMTVAGIEALTRRLSLKDFISTRNFGNKIDNENPTSPTDNPLNILELLLSKTRRKPALHKRSSSKTEKPSDLSDEQKLQSQTLLTQCQTSARSAEDQKQGNDLHFIVNLKAMSNTLSPTKVIRKVVGLPKMPFGKHSTYPSEVPFRKKHIVEKESAKWLSVHSSKRASPERKKLVNTRQLYSP